MQDQLVDIFVLLLHENMTLKVRISYNPILGHFASNCQKIKTLIKVTTIQ